MSAALPLDVLDARIPPHHLGAEQSVLGGLMLDPSRADDVFELLPVEALYHPAHAAIYRAIRAQVESLQPIDVVTLSEAMEQAGTLDSVGGLPALARMVQDTPTAVNILGYARIVREAAQARELIRRGGEIVALGFSRDEPIAARVDAAQELLSGLGEARGTEGLVPVADALAGFVDALEARFNAGGRIVGLPTGLADLDRLTAGLHPGNLIVIAGRPSMGKTTLAMGIAEHCAVRLGKPAAVFSLEMGREELLGRMVASLGRVELSHIRDGQLQDEEWPRLTHALQALKTAPLWIDDSPGLSAHQIRSRARKLHRRRELGVIVVDYLQLMSGGYRQGNRVEEITEISRSLKCLAKELSVPVIALSQLNRKCEDRPNKRPLLSDLRESGSIEQDADLVAFIYRDEMYYEDSPDKGTAEIIIRKQRNGDVGIVRCVFQGRHNRFADLASDWRPDPRPSRSMGGLPDGF
jgi:replicative DNA helicase